jgi:hypothetical protein
MTPMADEHRPGQEREEQPDSVDPNDQDLDRRQDQRQYEQSKVIHRVRNNMNIEIWGSSIDLLT